MKSITSIDLWNIIIKYISLRPSMNILLLNKDLHNQLKDVIIRKNSAYSLHKKLNFEILGGDQYELKKYLNTFSKSYIEDFTYEILDSKYFNSTNCNFRIRIFAKKYIRTNLFGLDKKIYNNIKLDCTYRVPLALYCKFRNNLNLKALIY